MINKTINYVGWSAISVATAATFLKYGQKITLFSAGGYTLLTTAGTTAVCFGLAKFVEHFASKKLEGSTATVVGIVFQGFIIAGGIYYKVFLLTAASPLVIFVGGGGFVLYKLFEAYQTNRQQTKDIDQLKKKLEQQKEIKLQLSILQEKFNKHKKAVTALENDIKEKKINSLDDVEKRLDQLSIDPEWLEISPIKPKSTNQLSLNLGTTDFPNISGDFLNVTPINLKTPNPSTPKKEKKDN